jgi:hypothetical protein
MSPKARDQRRLREDDFYRRPPRGDPAVQFRRPTTAETGAQIARPSRDSDRPPGCDNPDFPSGFGSGGRRGGLAAPARQSIAVSRREAEFYEKPWLLTTAYNDEDDDKDDAEKMQLQTFSSTAKETIAASEHATDAGVEDEPQKVSIWALACDETIEKQLPDQLWLSMRRDKAWLYPPEMICWHADLRVADTPRQRKLVLSEGLKAHVARNVALTFRYSDGNTAYSVGLTVKPGGGVQDLHCLDLHWITHSQLPGLRFTIKRGTGLPSACVWFFANTLELSTEQKNGRRCFVMAHKMGDRIKDGNDPTRDIKAEGTDAIWTTRFSTWSEKTVAAGAINGSPLTPARPQVSGISRTDLARLIATGAVAKTKGDLAVMSTGGWAIWGLMTTNDIQVNRRWKGHEKGRTIYSFFVQYMDMHLNTVLELGFWPHYVRQAQKAGKDLYTLNYDPRELEVPRNMVRTWRVRWRRDVPVAAEPETWLAFPILWMYPDEEAEAFGCRIGAERGRERKHLALDDGPQKSTGMAQKSKKKSADGEDEKDPSALLASFMPEAPFPKPLFRPLTTFDMVPAFRKAHEERDRKAREVYFKSVGTNQKRRRSMSKDESSVQDAEGDTIMAAEKPATDRLAKDQPTAKRQKIGEPPVPRQTIIHELPAGKRSYQQGPSVEEENALFVDDEQAIGEKPRVVVRLPW